MLKKWLRKIYYLIWNGKVRKIRSPEPLRGLKWIADKRYGRAYYKGYYEPSLVPLLISEFRKNDTFFDIGAHAGYFSLLVSQLANKGQVFSFEPVPENFEFIKKNKRYK